MSITFPNTWQVSKAILAVVLLHLSFPAAYAEDAPPSRVARLNYLDGTVSFSPAGTDDWSVATPNRPLTIGDRVWADKGARSELHIGSTAMRLGASTSLELLDLSDEDTQLKVTQGTFSIRVRSMDPDENVEIDTPNLAFVVREPGEYRFDVDPDRDTTMVTVRRGSGQAYGSDSDNRSVQMKADRQLTFSGSDLFYSYSGDAPPRDTFDRWAAERDDRENKARSVRYVSRDMTGYEELDDNGDWREVRDYGPVWVPRVTVRGWAPYHYGHWAWIAPWGWTWVDDERWGFAPFHYGRWAYIDDYWAWVPGPIVRHPVYAPALVGFIGGGSGGTHWGVSLSIGTPGVAWFALAPGEHYRPAYTSNPTYITNINRTVVVNRTVVHNVYVNQRVPHAIAAMPASDFVRGQPAHEHRREVREDRLKDFSKMPSASSLPVAPVRQSLAGAARESRAAPPERVRDHAVIVRRQAPEAPAFHDNLARKFAAQQGTVPGAGPVFTPTVKPVRDNPPASNRGSPADASAGRRPGDDGRTRSNSDDRDARPAARPGIAAPAQAVGKPEEARREAPAADAPRPPPQSRREEPAARPGMPGTMREAPAAPRIEPANTGRDRTREAAPEAPRPPVAEPRRDPVRIEPPQAAPERRATPVEAPRLPAAVEARPTPSERPRDEVRTMRGDRPQNDRPSEQAPRPERSSAPERRNDIREARPVEERRAEERRVEQARPPKAEPERNDRNQRMNERPAEQRPPQAAPREERPQKPESERRENKRGEQRP